MKKNDQLIFKMKTLMKKVKIEEKNSYPYIC